MGFLNDFGPAFVEGLEEFLFGKALSLEHELTEIGESGSGLGRLMKPCAVAAKRAAKAELRSQAVRVSARQKKGSAAKAGSRQRHRARLKSCPPE